jgi:hypothetical protein
MRGGGGAPKKMGLEGPRPVSTVSGGDESAMNRPSSRAQLGTLMSVGPGQLSGTRRWVQG